ncbi:unnamed protein product [Parnassius apollo]|uniref:Glycosyltransferase family 92 protein n=1 Tax=Parnassius apollo TaxID=110799 RepID=A0A8S3Y1E9_PARAO|nr:unnamed protein product [Parnassius apollo]
MFENRTWSPHVYSDSWQRVKGTPVSLYAAYYDERAPQRYVRILAIFHGRNISAGKPLYCQTRSFNSSEDSIEVVAAKPLEMWWHEWDTASSTVETPFLLSCPLTDSLYDLSVVSIVTEPCEDPGNAFVLKPQKKLTEYKRTFTICVKDMNFNKNMAQNLIEWIETNKILGVDLIDVYIDEISEETQNVLLRYKDQGNLAESEYIVPLDVDEILLPKIAFNLSELLRRLRKFGWNPKKYSSILVQNVFFFDFMQGVHKYKFFKNVFNKSKMYVKRDNVRINEAINMDVEKIELEDDSNTLTMTELDNLDKENLNKYGIKCKRKIPIPKLSQNIIRSALVSPVGYYSKSMMLTRRVLTAFNHYPLTNLGMTGFAGWSAPFSEVQLNHYKESCNTTMVAECVRYGQRTRVDRSALRLHPRLTQALASALCHKIKTF